MKFKFPEIRITDEAEQVLVTSSSVFLAISVTQLILSHNGSVIIAFVVGLCTYGVAHVIWKNLSRK